MIQGNAGVPEDKPTDTSIFSIRTKVRFTGSETTFTDFKNLIEKLIVQLKEEVVPPFRFSKRDKDPLKELELVCFLDFDGVCWPDPAFCQDPKLKVLCQNQELTKFIESHWDFLVKHFDFNAVDEFFKLACWDLNNMKRIATLCEKYKTKIVVTSNWRHGRDPRHLQNLLDLWGLGQYVVDKLKDKHPDFRPLEIRDWVRVYKPKHYIIYEDGYVSPMRELHGEKFIQCQSRVGFDEKAFVQADTLLSSYAKPGVEPELAEHMQSQCSLKARLGQSSV